jgi:hypothetical protein
VRTRALLLSIPVAAYLLALPDSDAPDWVAPLIVAGYVVGPYVIGAIAGWRALLIFPVVYFAASILYQVLFWHNDPDLRGIDDIPPVAGIVLVVPVMLLPMAFGATSRALSARMRRRGARGD